MRSLRRVAAEISGDDFLVLPDVVRRSMCDEPSQRQHGQRVGDGEDGVHVVLDQHDRVILLQATQKFDHPLRLFRPHACERLIENQNTAAAGDQRGDFELALFVVRRESGDGAELCIGFAGGAPATLQAVFDADKRDDAFVDTTAADWVDDHLDGDYAIKKLSSYLMQSQLSMGLAMRTFKECFLGE